MAYHDSSDTPADSDNRKLVCPQCGQTLIRIQRRPADRVISLFSPVKRFRCSNHSCQWEGSIKTKAQRSYSGASHSNSRL